MAGSSDYSATPLPAKLGIREGDAVAIVGAPAGFDKTLGSLPPGVEVRRGARGRLDVALVFVTRRADLARRFDALRRAVAPAGGLWVAWPKKASDLPTDLTFAEVQGVGLAAGLVDNKSCSIDGNWQAVRFVVRLGDRPPGRGPSRRRLG